VTPRGAFYLFPSIADFLSPDGIRTSIEFADRLLAEELEMVFLMTAPEYLFVSASRVKELVAFGAPVDKLVPVNVAKALAKKAKQRLRTGATEPAD